MKGLQHLKTCTSNITSIYLNAPFLQWARYSWASLEASIRSFSKSSNFTENCHHHHHSPHHPTRTKGTSVGRKISINTGVPTRASTVTNARLIFEPRSHQFGEASLFFRKTRMSTPSHYCNPHSPCSSRWFVRRADNTARPRRIVCLSESTSILPCTG